MLALAIGSDKVAARTAVKIVVEHKSLNVFLSFKLFEVVSHFDLFTP